MKNIGLKRKNGNDANERTEKGEINVFIHYVPYIKKLD